jgi:hypothetical protein
MENVSMGIVVTNPLVYLVRNMGPVPNVGVNFTSLMGFVDQGNILFVGREIK